MGGGGEGSNSTPLIKNLTLNIEDGRARFECASHVVCAILKLAEKMYLHQLLVL